MKFSDQQHECLWLEVMLWREGDDRLCANFGELQLLSSKLDPFTPHYHHLAADGEEFGLIRRHVYPDSLPYIKLLLT